MSNRPIGFGPGRRPPRRTATTTSGSSGGQPDPSEAFNEVFAQLLGGGAAGEEIAKALGAATGGAELDPAMLQAMMSQLQTMMSTAGDGPVNWTLATDVARQTVSAAGDSSVGAADRRAVEETLRLADLWLDPVTTLTSAGARALTWSRAEWVEGTLPGLAAAGRAGRRERRRRDGRGDDPADPARAGRADAGHGQRSPTWPGR